MTTTPTTNAAELAHPVKIETDADGCFRLADVHMASCSLCGCLFDAGNLPELCGEECENCGAYLEAGEYPRNYYTEAGMDLIDSAAWGGPFTALAMTATVRIRQTGRTWRIYALEGSDGRWILTHRVLTAAPLLFEATPGRFDRLRENRNPAIELELDHLVTIVRR